MRLEEAMKVSVNGCAIIKIKEGVITKVIQVWANGSRTKVTVFERNRRHPMFIRDADPKEICGYAGWQPEQPLGD